MAAAASTAASSAAVAASAGAAGSSALLGLLSEVLPRLSDCRGWCVLSACSFGCLHLLLLLLLRLVQETPSLCARFPLLQRGAWPRHGINRLLSILHSSVSCTWALSIVLLEADLSWDSLSAYFGTPLTPLQRPIFLYSLSFFLYDLVYVLFEGDIASTLHHVAAASSCFLVLAQQQGGSEVLTGLAIGEVSSPLLHLRYFARHFQTVAERQQQQHEQKQQQKQQHQEQRRDGEETTAPSSPSEAKRQQQQQDKQLLQYWAPSCLFGFPFSVLNRLFETLFVSVFFVARGLVNPCITWLTLRCVRTSLLVKASAATVCSLSFFWLAQITWLILKRGAATRHHKQH